MLTPRRIILAGAVVGSVLGGWLPSLWGAGGLTLTATATSTLGGLAGIWVGWKLSRSL